ncbi:hypothetical protein [Arthrobacter oryzae]|uniref:hypothetical protein n=1 Tax=Arthrobacter oryzae TaxID=409290 RepID=UPI0011CDBB43|nr:hypothetical protein [Arthrobacter oryzae]
MASASPATASAAAVQAPDSSLVAWMAVLDVLEAAVEAAERALNDPLGPLASAHGVAAARWSAPSLSGPLPAAASRRAVALAAAQERVSERLEAARRDVIRQLNAVKSVPGVGERPGAVYLDLNG